MGKLIDGGNNNAKNYNISVDLNNGSKGIAGGYGSNNKF